MHRHPRPARDDGKALAGYIDNVQGDSRLESLPGKNGHSNTGGRLQSRQKSESRTVPAQDDRNADRQRGHADEYEDDLPYARQRHRLGRKSEMGHWRRRVGCVRSRPGARADGQASPGGDYGLEQSAAAHGFNPPRSR
jgi:hypothetical protein